MSERTRDLSFGVMVAVLLASAIAVDAWVGGAPAPKTSALPRSYFERAEFCPPTSDQQGSTYVVSANDAGSDVSIGLKPEVDDPIELSGDHISIHKNAKDAAVDVVSYRAPARSSAVETFPSPVNGVGAARCASAASAHWYFADGSTSLGFDERIVLYNPFPDEAVANISLFTPGGVKVKANLTDLAVPTGRAVIVKLNEFALQQRLLAVAVDMNRGRVVAWKSVSVKAENHPSGVQLTLGATQAHKLWYLPEGGIAPGLDERVTLLNPGPDEAIVTMSVMTSKETLQPPKLVEVRVPGTSVKQIDLTAAAGRSGGDLGGASVVVRSANDRGVIAERTTYYSSNDLSGTAAEIGSYRVSESWFLPPAVMQPVTESIVVMNPGTVQVNATIRLLGASGQPLEPKSLQAEIPAGARFKFPLGQVTKGAPMFAVVEADGLVVAERVGYSGTDVAAVLGWPVRPTEQ